jgi:acetylornithine deacetylase/succinyl-diaminopimelate desuccinylase
MSATFDLADFHRRAVETDSTESVDEMRTVLLDTLDAADVAASVDDLGNVVATRGAADHEAAASADTHLVLNTHIDTVPPHVPYERRTGRPGDEAVDGSEDAGEGDVVCGRGACDAKGPLAALLEAFLTVDPSDGAVTLAVSIDEETTQTGGAHLAETVDADGYIVGEPTGLDVCTAARGQFEGTVTIRGSAAHAASPEEGRNAIRAAAPVLEAMDGFDDAAGTSAHDLLGEPTLTATTIRGGEAPNQVPAECRIGFDRRSVPPEASDEVPAALEAHLGAALPEGFELSVELTPREVPQLEAFETDAEAPVVRALADASGGAVPPLGAGTEATFFAEGASTVGFGTGDLADDEGAVAHAGREYVRLDEVRRAAAALRRAVEADALTAYA